MAHWQKSLPDQCRGNLKHPERWVDSLYMYIVLCYVNDDPKESLNKNLHTVIFAHDLRVIRFILSPCATQRALSNTSIGISLPCSQGCFHIYQLWPLPLTLKVLSSYHRQHVWSLSCFYFSHVTLKVLSSRHRQHMIFIMFSFFPCFLESFVL